MRVRAVLRDRQTMHGLLLAGPGVIPCVFGRSGVARFKREGDGATPAGRFLLRRVFFRSDRCPWPGGGLPAAPIRPDLGWCDEPGDPRYNRPIRLPAQASHEVMWREDALYDYVIEVGYNDAPPVAGRGSAIFLHLARPDFSPTEGCIAVARTHMRQLLARLRPGDTIDIA